MRDYCFTANVRIKNRLVVSADSEDEARALAAANLFTVFDAVPLFDDEVCIADEIVESVEIEEDSFCPMMKSSSIFCGEEEYEPEEYFSD